MTVNNALLKMSGEYERQAIPVDLVDVDRAGSKRNRWDAVPCSVRIVDPIFNGQSHQLIHIYIRPQGRKRELALLNKIYI